MKKLPTEGRIVFSPSEFAALFGKSQTWGYRQIYAGKIKAITEFGRIQIPAAEVERILETAGIYNGLPAKQERSKNELQKLVPKIGGAWQTYLERRREAVAGKHTKVPANSKMKAIARTEALRRLSRT